MTASDAPDGEGDPRAFPDGRLSLEAVIRLLTAFDRLSCPMLIADDDRRAVACNRPAADLLGIPQQELRSRTIDEFLAPDARAGLPQHWEAFLGSGAAEGLCELSVPGRGLVPVEFSATANVLPALHISILISPDDGPSESLQRTSAFGSLAVAAGDAPLLTRREREIMTLVAAGGRSSDMAERLFVSPTTVKSHVDNAMSKLGARTRAQAVARALLTGQITLEP